MASPDAVKSTSTKMVNEDNIPIFLRKTYHMVDSCDAKICSWGDDGTTFIVKDPVKFEKEIIPQFFKHSKFSSFVRQLNFYAFRKIKFADTIRIDPKLEAETANYWRFKHEKFLQGRPDLLCEIKRMNGSNSNANNSAASQNNKNDKNTTAVVKKETFVAAEKENNQLKSEVSTLKQRIEDMTKNIDELTDMVKKVTVSAAAQTQNPPPVERVNMLTHKRKKLDEPSPELLPLSTSSAPATASAMDMEDDIPMPPSLPSPLRTTERETSDLSDEGFVDQLFTAFNSKDFEFDDISATIPTPSSDDERRPKPELMDRLSQALSLLPHEIQELIVDRLIQAITAPKTIQDHISAASCLDDVIVAGAKAITPRGAVPQSPKHQTTATDDEGSSASDSEGEDEEQEESSPTEVGLNLAAATLAALIQQYGQLPKSSKRQAHKSLPVIPVHA